PDNPGDLLDEIDFDVDVEAMRRNGDGDSGSVGSVESKAVLSRRMRRAGRDARAPGFKSQSFQRVDDFIGRKTDPKHLLQLRQTHDDSPPTNLVVIKRMQRLAHLEHHVVGDINDIIDGPQSHRFKAAGQPAGAGADADVANEPRGIVRAKWRFNGNANSISRS